MRQDILKTEAHSIDFESNQENVLLPTVDSIFLETNVDGEILSEEYINILDEDDSEDELGSGDNIVLEECYKILKLINKKDIGVFELWKNNCVGDIKKWGLKNKKDEDKNFSIFVLEERCNKYFHRTKKKNTSCLFVLTPYAQKLGVGIKDKTDLEKQLEKKFSLLKKIYYMREIRQFFIQKLSKENLKHNDIIWYVNRIFRDIDLGQKIFRLTSKRFYYPESDEAYREMVLYRGGDFYNIIKTDHHDNKLAGLIEKHKI